MEGRLSDYIRGRCQGSAENFGDVLDRGLLDYVPVPRRWEVTQVDPPPHAGRRIWSTDGDGRGGFLGERGGSFLGRPRRREKTEGIYCILL